MGTESFIFDHCYRLIADDGQYKDFERRGFLLCPRPAKHPGRLVCQFLHFKSPAGDPVYLEFCYRDETLPPEDNENADESAGFSLRSTGSLGTAFGRVQEELAGWMPQLEHRNYDWSRDASQVLPGWNFLTFGQSPLKGTEIWITEYERRPDWTDDVIQMLRSEREALRQHSNTARQILGFVWKASKPETLVNLARICQSKVEFKQIKLGGGTTLFGLDEADPELSLFRNKKSDFLAVVLRVESLETFVQKAAADEIVSFQGMKAAVIRLGDNAWDILAVESLDAFVQFHK